MCFGLDWFESIIIWIIVVCAVIALLKLLVAFVLPKVGLAGELLNFLTAAFQIIFWAVICIALAVFIFDLIACAMTFLHVFPRMR